MPQFQVIGDVMGEDVMGDDDEEVVGYDEDGDPIIVSGRRKRRRKARRGGSTMTVHKAEWRKSQLAPGVIAPEEGLVPLPLSGNAGVNTFSVTVTSITFQGVMQKPFRGESLLVSVQRTGTTATGRLLGQIFVGTDLQQADLTGVDLELIGAVQGFGIRLTMKPAQPGVWIRFPTVLSSNPTGTDTIFVSMQLLGRIEH
jgi:hypothetical protein